MKHWAYDYIGKPWRPGAEGPRAFYCWGLTKHVYKTRLGVYFPDGLITPEVGTEDILKLTRAANLHRVDDPPREYDIVLFRSFSGKRHVGTFVHANGILGVLHANGAMRNGVSEGCVQFERVSEVLASGFNTPELWRIR